MKHAMIKRLGFAALFIVGNVSTISNVSAGEHLLLVHGAHFAADSWSQLTPHISASTTVHAINLPARDDSINAEKIGLSDYAQSLCQDLSHIKGDIHIAAHSQGGAVAHRALSLCPDIAVNTIIYVTSVAPINGQTAFELLNKTDFDNYMASMTFDETNHRMMITDKTAFAQHFAQDANAKQSKILVETALSEPAHIGDEIMVLQPERLASVKQYYVFANHDKIISLASQMKVAAQIDLEGVYALDAGHSPMLTKPKALARILNHIIDH